MNSDLDELARGGRDLIVLHDGRTMVTHGPNRCLGEYCCIHKPSEHRLRNAPLTWVSELKVMYRVCEHASIHPDPDDVSFRTMLVLIGAIAPWGLSAWHPCCEQFCCNEAAL